MPTLFGRQYGRKLSQVSSTERILGGLIVICLAVLMLTFVVQVATNKDHLFEVDESGFQVFGGSDERKTLAENESPFPDPMIEGWGAPKTVSRYSPENLHVKINGRAEEYLKFNVEGLTFGTYYHRTDADRRLDVYWYDMGNSENAIAMFNRESSPDGRKLELGNGGYETGGTVFFCSGSSYVQILPTNFDGADTTVALSIATQLAERTAGVNGIE
ncbi:MAG: hypothetical protein JSU63_15875 [Phycisphaerales bacterium]|nr:MAG: hypothetical protein JSU63_15875 [Phycisphaerales bacterium]